MNKIKLDAVNRHTKLSIVKIQLSNSSVEFAQLSDEMRLEVQLGNIQIFDMSNYPDTICSENEWKTQQSYEMIGLSKKQQNKSQNIIEVSFTAYSDKSPKIKDGLATIIRINVNQIHINVMLQPLLRLIDYLFSQLLASLSAKTLEQIEQEKKKQEEDPLDYLRQQGQLQVLDSIQNPKNMVLKIYI